MGYAPIKSPSVQPNDATAERSHFSHVLVCGKLSFNIFSANSFPFAANLFA
jgi:hypothetical protein